LQPTFQHIPASVVEAGAIVPGLAGDVPGGGVVPVDSGTEPGEVAPIIPVVAAGMVEMTESVDSNGVVTGNKYTHVVTEKDPVHSISSSKSFDIKGLFSNNS